MKPPFAEIEFAPPLVERRDRGGGSFELFSPVPLQPYAKSLAHLLRLQAETFPKKDFLAERDASGAWRRVTFGEASRRADSIAQALLDRGCAPDRPVMILSGNGIDHALIMLGAFVAGVPVVPGLGRLFADEPGLREAETHLRRRAAGSIYASNGKIYAKALGALDLSGTRLVRRRRAARGSAAELLSDLLDTAPTQAVDARLGRRRARHDRENPLHLRLHRHAQGRRSTRTA